MSTPTPDELREYRRNTIRPLEYGPPHEPDHVQWSTRGVASLNDEGKRRAMEAAIEQAGKVRAHEPDTVAGEMLEELRRENAYLRGRHRHWFTEAAKARGEVGGLRRERDAWRRQCSEQFEEKVALREHLRAITHCGELLQAKRIARRALNPTEVDG